MRGVFSVLHIVFFMSMNSRTAKDTHFMSTNIRVGIYAQKKENNKTRRTWGVSVEKVIPIVSYLLKTCF